MAYKLQKDITFSDKCQGKAFFKNNVFSALLLSKQIQNTTKKSIRFTSSLFYLIFFTQEIKKWSEMSEKSKSSSDLKFNVEIEGMPQKTTAFNKK